MSSHRLPWMITGGALLVAGAVLVLTREGGAATHPDPRPGVTAEKVLPDFAVPRQLGAAEAYAAARGAPQVLDGVYCHCNCAKHSGHRSLLTCFESEHGAYCDICMGEAVLATRMAREGVPLPEIRRAIDEQYGR